jgi:hypothetical protein
MAYRYDPSRKALLTPARDTSFFRAGRPTSEAALCAELARLAYAPFEREPGAKTAVVTTLQHIAFSEILFFSSASTQAFLARDPLASLAILAFRGTEVDIRDWATDLDTLLIPWSPGARVHRGFAQALELIWSPIAAALAGLSGRLLFTGHSLGAALATLAASRCLPHALYTYGSPRIGDVGFGHTMADLIHHRFVHCCDIVSRVPFEVLDYRHVGQLTYLDHQGHTRAAPTLDAMVRDQAIARRHYAWRWAWRPGTMWTRDAADHAPINYVAPLMQRPPAP